MFKTSPKLVFNKLLLLIDEHSTHEAERFKAGIVTFINVLFWFPLFHIALESFQKFMAFGFVSFVASVSFAYFVMPRNILPWIALQGFCFLIYLWAFLPLNFQDGTSDVTAFAVLLLIILSGYFIYEYKFNPKRSKSMKDTLKETLRAYWLDALDKAEIRTVYTENYFDHIWSAYRQEWRAFHTEYHLHELIVLFGRLESKFKNPLAVLFAIFFHDIIYDPLKPEKNESKSIKKAQKFFKKAKEYQLGLITDTDKKDVFEAVFDNLKDEVLAIIDATKGAKAPEDNKDAQIFVDMDLSILAAPDKKYLGYCRQIRQEFSHLSTDIFIEKRAELFLKPMLARLEIFTTEFFKGEEEQARRNMKGELNNMKPVYAIV